MYPQADVFTHVFDPTKFPELVAEQHRATESCIGRLPGAKRFYQRILPLMPVVLEQTAT